MATVHPGYKGSININGISTRFTDASITARQSIEAPDIIMGDWDHDAYVYGKIEVGGSISGPVTETFASGGAGGLWDWAITRTGCGALTEGNVTVYYYCGDDGSSSRQFTGMLCNTMTFSCAAGEVAQFSMDVMGKSAGSWGSSNVPNTTAEKLLTWDRVNVTCSGENIPSDLIYSNFEISIGNNLAPVYSLGQANLFPYQIVPGLRTITGSISVYNTPDFKGFDKWIDYLAANAQTITFGIGAIIKSVKVRFHRVESASSVGPIISTVGFTGVTHQTI